MAVSYTIPGMKTGYLTLLTHPDHTGLVRARIEDDLPELKPLDDGSEIRYVARFNDVEAALMHVQNAMHGALTDLENRIYRKPLTAMIACVEADILDHARIWIDPGLGEEMNRRIARETRRRVARQRRIDRIWQALGLFALLLLLLNSLRL